MVGCTCWLNTHPRAHACVQAAELKPTFEQGHVRLGVAQFGCKDFVGARRSYQNALNLSPDNEEYKKAIESCKNATDQAAADNVSGDSKGTLSD